MSKSKNLKEYEKEFKQKFAILFKKGFRIILFSESGAMYQLGLQNARLRINAVFGFRGSIMGIGKRTAQFEFSDAFTEKAEWHDMWQLTHNFRQQKNLEVLAPEPGLYGSLSKSLEPVIDDVLKYVQNTP